MPKRSTAWKGAEYQFARLFVEHGVNAERRSRAANWSEKDYEVHVLGLMGQDPIWGDPEKGLKEEWLRCDSKYKSQGFAHHRLFEEIEYKYCKEKTDEPVLFTKQYRQNSGYITIRADFFMRLLRVFLDKGAVSG